MLKKERFYGRKLPVVDNFERADAWCDRRRARWTMARWVACFAATYFFRALYALSGKDLSLIDFVVIAVVCYYVPNALFKKYSPTSEKATCRVVSADAEAQTVRIVYFTETEDVPLLIIDDYPALEIQEEDYLVYDVRIKAYGKVMRFNILHPDSSLVGQVNLATIEDARKLGQSVELIFLIDRVVFPVILMNQVVLIGGLAPMLLIGFSWALIRFFDLPETLFSEFQSESWEVDPDLSRCDFNLRERKVEGEMRISRNSAITNRPIYRTVKFVDSIEALPDDKFRLQIFDDSIEFSRADIDPVSSESSTT